MTRGKILETALRRRKTKTQRTCCLDFLENLAMDLIWDDENTLWKASALKVCRQIKGYVPIASSSALSLSSFVICEKKPVPHSDGGEAWPPESFETKTC